MKRRLFIKGLFFIPWCGAALPADPLAAMQETPMFVDEVKARKLPPVARRVPEQPLVVRTFAGNDGPGRHGGPLTMLVTGTRDTVLMTIYSYARLIVYDGAFQLKPDILESYDSKEDREVTFKLRAGHRWSDGHPFTTEDFRYYWEDIANVKELTKHGPSVVLLVDGKPPKVEIYDELTIRYSWEKPNPYFIASHAQAATLWVFRPSHYLKKFHAKYTTESEILKSAKGAQETWNSIHKRLDTMYYDSNPDLPTLNPWMLTTAPPASRLVYDV